MAQFLAKWLTKPAGDAVYVAHTLDEQKSRKMYTKITVQITGPNHAVHMMWNRSGAFDAKFECGCVSPISERQKKFGKYYTDPPGE